MAVVVCWAVFIGGLLVRNVRAGRPMSAVLVCWCVSSIPIAVLAQVMEHRSVPFILVHYFAYLSWAFLFGDAVFLPFALAMMARGWKKLPKTGWHRSRRWTTAAFAIAIVVALIARFANNLPRYRAFEAMRSFFAPTMEYHDYVSFPVLFGALLCLGLPLFVERVNRKKPYVAFRHGAEKWWALGGVALLIATWLAHDLGNIPQFLTPNDWMWPE